jgi:DNA-binding CsgD family transcriptional regulator
MTRGTSLARGEASRAQSALIALCGRGLSTGAFGQELRARLQRLLAFDAYCLNACDPETGVVTSSVGDGLSPEHARTLFRIEAQASDLNCLSALRRGPTRAASLWQTSGGRPEQSQRMREIFLPLGFGDELRAALLVAATCYGYLHLFRRAGRAPFGPDEVTWVGSLSAPIARALRAAAALGVCRASRSNDSERSRPGLILVDGADRVVRQSPGAERMLGVRDSLRIESGLAHVLIDVASRSRRGKTARATLVGERVRALSVSALQLGAETAIVLDEPSAQQAQGLSLALFGLTPREREVSRLLMAGHSNQSIAAELGIGHHTVKDHVKAVLSKTGCRARGELAARLGRV